MNEGLRNFAGGVVQLDRGRDLYRCINVHLANWPYYLANGPQRIPLQLRRPQERSSEREIGTIILIDDSKAAAAAGSKPSMAAEGPNKGFYFSLLVLSRILSRTACLMV